MTVRSQGLPGSSLELSGVVYVVVRCRCPSWASLRLLSKLLKARASSSSCFSSSGCRLYQDPASQIHRGFPTKRVPKMPLSGVSARLARFTFKALDGTSTGSLCLTSKDP